MQHLHSIHMWTGFANKSETNTILAWEEMFVSFFTIYGHGAHVGHVIQTILNNLSFPQSQEAIYESW